MALCIKPVYLPAHTVPHMQALAQLCSTMHLSMYNYRELSNGVLLSIHWLNSHIRLIGPELQLQGCRDGWLFVSEWVRNQHMIQCMQFVELYMAI